MTRSYPRSQHADEGGMGAHIEHLVPLLTGQEPSNPQSTDDKDNEGRDAQVIDLTGVSALRERVSADIERDLAEAELTPRFDEEVTLKRATEALGRAIDVGDIGLQMRAELLQAHVWIRRGLSEECAAILRRVNQWASDNEDTYLLARSHRLFSRFYRALGDHAKSLVHAVQAAKLVDPDRDIRAAIETEIALADALCENGYSHKGFQNYDKAAARSRDIGDHMLETVCLNNMAYFMWDAGEIEQAQVAAERCKAVLLEHGMQDRVYLIDTRARIELSLGHVYKALETMRPVLEDDPTIINSQTGLLLALQTLADIYTTLGDDDLAEQSLVKCQSLSESSDSRRVLIGCLTSRAEIRARANDHKAAYEMLLQARGIESRLVSEQQDARARTFQALYETTEARKDSDRFRQLSLSDPLTAVYNRRYVDENLPAILARAGSLGQSAIVALLDLDHFKQVNDRYSHAAGDKVLEIVADLASRVINGKRPRPDESSTDGVEIDLRDDVLVGAKPFVARMGGEEFLIVLPATTRADGLALLDSILVELRHYDWSDITPNSVVTASLGACVAEHPMAVVEALTLADKNLYLAKSGGRDRLVCEDSPSEV